MKPAFKNLSKSLATFQAELSAADNERRKAAQAAVRVEGFRLKKLLAKEIQAGAPGGAKFKALSVIARKLGRGAEGRTPLKRLATPVRYWVENGNDRFAVKVGYQADNVVNSHGAFFKGKDLEDGTSQATAKSRLSASWLNIIKNTIEGKSFPAGKFQRDMASFAKSARFSIVHSAFGGQPGKKKLKAGRKPFLLKKSTASLRIPSRRIIEPFWWAHQARALANIRRNFEQKMAGQRI